MSYENVYVEFDEIGMKSIKCQCCGKEVMRRSYVEIEIKSEPVRIEKALTLQKLSHYRRVPLALSDGSIIHLHMCSVCERNENFDISKDNDKCDKIIGQIRDTFKIEDQFHGIHKDDIEENSKKWDSLQAIKSFKAEISFKEVLEKGKQAVDEFKESIK